MLLDFADSDLSVGIGSQPSTKGAGWRCITRRSLGRSQKEVAKLFFIYTVTNRGSLIRVYP
jgi:hypothetical protein